MGHRTILVILIEDEELDIAMLQFIRSHMTSSSDNNLELNGIDDNSTSGIE